MFCLFTYLFKLNSFILILNYRTNICIDRYVDLSQFHNSFLNFNLIFHNISVLVKMYHKIFDLFILILFRIEL